MPVGRDIFLVIASVVIILIIKQVFILFYR